MKLETELIQVICLYLAACYFIYHIKPEIMFTNKGEFKNFGLHKYKNETIFPYWLVVTIVGIGIYYFINIRDINLV